MTPCSNHHNWKLKALNGRKFYTFSKSCSNRLPLIPEFAELFCVGLIRLQETLMDYSISVPSNRRNFKCWRFGFGMVEVGRANLSIQRKLQTIFVKHEAHNVILDTNKQIVACVKLCKLLIINQIIEFYIHMHF